MIYRHLCSLSLRIDTLFCKALPLSLCSYYFLVVRDFQNILPKAAFVTFEALSSTPMLLPF